MVRAYGKDWKGRTDLMEVTVQRFLADPYLMDWVIAGLIILLAFLLALFSMPGNTLMMLTGIGFAFYNPAKYQDMRLLTAMAFVYVFGELWEFGLSFFGIKKVAKKMPWWAVGILGLTTFAGTVCGTLVLPVIGSVVGGAVAAFLAAYVYEYGRTRSNRYAGALAWKAAKMQCLAIAGKLVATFILALLLIRQIFFFH